MRIYLCEASGKGGMIQYDYHLCRALQRIGIETTLVTSKVYELEDLPHEFRVVKLLNLWDPRSGKSNHPLLRRIQRGARGLQYVWAWFRLVLCLRKDRPDVVLFGEIRFPFELYFLRILHLMNLKLADIVHDVQPFDTRQESDNLLEVSQRHLRQYNLIYSTFDALFVHDRSNCDLFMNTYQIPSKFVHEIRHGNNEIILETPQVRTPNELQNDLGIGPSQPTVLFFGTITKYKGLEDLIEAFPTVYEATGAQLIVAGFPAKDVDVEKLKLLATQNGMMDHTSWWLDYIPNSLVASLLAISSIVVLPYRAITQSGVLQIAFSCGKPVVATRTGGLPNVIEEGKSGLLTPPEDPPALAEAIIKLLKDPDALQQMGLYAKNVAETRYGWINIAENIKAVFESLD